MTDEIKLKLVDLVEKSVVASLVAHNYVTVTNKQLKFSNCVLTSKANSIINYQTEKKDEVEQLIKELKNIFPKDSWDSDKVLIDRYNMWKNKTTFKDITYDQIIAAADNWCKKHNYSQYVGKMYKFFYYMDGATYVSRLEDMLGEDIQPQSVLIKDYNITIS